MRVPCIRTPTRETRCLAVTAILLLTLVGGENKRVSAAAAMRLFGAPAAARSTELPDYEFGPDATWTWSAFASEYDIATVLKDGYRLVDLEVISADPLRFTAVYVKN